MLRKPGPWSECDCRQGLMVCLGLEQDISDADIIIYIYESFMGLGNKFWWLRYICGCGSWLLWWLLYVNSTCFWCEVDVICKFSICIWFVAVEEKKMSYHFRPVRSKQRTKNWASWINILFRFQWPFQALFGFWFFWLVDSWGDIQIYSSSFRVAWSSQSFWPDWLWSLWALAFPSN